MQVYLSQVSKKTYHTPEVVELQLTLKKPSSVKFRAGQFVFFNIGGAYKAYSMISSPTDRKNLRFLIKLEKNGRAAKFVENLKVEDEMEFTGPEGYFFVREKNKNILCLAGGIGVAPFVSIIPNLLEKKYPGEITLIFGAKTEKNLYHKNFFQALSVTYPNFYFIPLVNDSVTDQNHKYPKAAGYLKENFQKYQSFIFYVCGSKEFVSDIEEILKSQGVDEDNIRLETFLN